MLTLLVTLSTAQAEELRLWHAYRGAERDALLELVEEWDAERDDIEVVPLYTPYESFFTKLEAAAPRGNGPDLFIAAHERLGSWVRTDLVAEAPSVPEGLHPTTVEAFSFDDTTYGVPLAFKCLALYVNDDLVQHPPETTDALVATARELTQDGRFGLAYEATSPYFHIPWMTGFGGGVFDESGVALDQPGNAEALAFVAELNQAGLLPEEPTGALVTQLFNSGQAGMVINGPWFLAELDPALDFSVHPLPVVSATGQPARPFLTVEGALVSTYAKQPDAAWDLAQFLASPEAARKRAIEGRQSVATTEVYTLPEVTSDPILSAFRAQLDRTVPMPNRPEMASTWEPMARAVRRGVRGAMKPATAVQQAQEEYRVISRPPPEPKNPAPYLAVAGVLLLAGLGAAGRFLANRRGELRRWAHAYPYVLPAIVAMLLLVFLPFSVGAAVSLFSHRDGSFTFVGLSNFFDIILARDWSITSPMSFYFTLVVTILWTAANVSLHVSIGLALAMLLREPWLKLRGVYRVLLIIPWAVPNYITALIWKGMFHRQFGAINGMLAVLGIEPISWFSKFSTAFAANLTTNTWLGFPFMMVVTLGALQAIPRDLEDAASVDGATGWQRFRHVTLPLLLPALLPAVVLGSVWTFNMFNIIYLVSGGEPDGATEILISEAYRWAFTRGYRYGYAAAYAVLIFGVLFFYSKATDRLLARRAG